MKCLKQKIVMSLLILFLIGPVMGCLPIQNQTTQKSWTIPPRPILNPDGENGKVCFKNEEIKRLFSYIEELRTKAIEHGAVEPNKK